MSIEDNEIELLQAAIAWWKMHCPEDWTVSQHTAFPTINLSDTPSKRLARAVSEIVKGHVREYRDRSKT